MILGFLLYTIVLAALLPIPDSIRHNVTSLNAAIFLLYGGLIASDRSVPITGLRGSRSPFAGARYAGVP